jgi:hypothetical protein
MVDSPNTWLQHFALEEGDIGDSRVLLGVESLAMFTDSPASGEESLENEDGNRVDNECCAQSKACSKDEENKESHVLEYHARIRKEEAWHGGVANTVPFVTLGVFAVSEQGGT